MDEHPYSSGVACIAAEKRRMQQSVTGIKHREHLRKAHIGRTISDKPTSHLQKYRITEKGRTRLTERMDR
jgi:hypothetical protein